MNLSVAAMHFIPSDTALPVGTLLLDNAADVLADSGQLGSSLQQGSIALQFPKWTDGRAYSQAVLLRSRLRHTGPLIATGDVLVDMLPLLQRCGFDSVQLRAGQSLEAAQRALGFFGTQDTHHKAWYQTVPPERSAPSVGASFGSAASSSAAFGNEAEA